MTVRKFPSGPPAPWLCRRCQRMVWWVHLPDRTSVLVDVKGRRRCHPLMRYRYLEHRLPGNA